MKPERWQEIRKILHEAIELPPGEVEAFLDQSCHGDAELRRQVEALIRADERAGKFLSGPILGERKAKAGDARSPSATQQSGLLTGLLRRFDETQGAQAEHGARFSPGEVLDDRFRIVHLAGRGGMGEVYRADDLKLGQAVALKFLSECAEGDEKKRSRLIEEVKIARQVSHPNVCRVYDVGEIDGHPFLSMEYVEGEDLASLLRRIGRPTQEKALQIARQLLDGLSAAHLRGVLHCDLKPANLMIDGEGQVRITDFGIARAAGSPSGTGIHGTPAYMAPEQLTTREVSPETDVYALGLVLYELFTGRRAFEADTAAELIRAHREKRPVPPTHLVENIDPAVERLILRCLEKDPRDRPASASDVAGDLPDDDPSSRAVPGKTLLVSDLRGQAREELGKDQARYLDRLYQRVVRGLQREHMGLEVERSGTTLQLLFDRPIHAVRYALAFHRAVAKLSEGEGMSLVGRIGIHLSEISPPESSAQEDRKTPRPKAVDLEAAERLTSLAHPRQVLMSRGVFDVARQSPATGLHGVRWLAHGSYELAGLVEPLEICEVGEEGFAPLRPPAESAKGRRRIVQETISGWRPAPGQGLPHRPNWTVEKRLGEGGFGEVWLAVHKKTEERRVFKFCYDPARLRSLQREITLFRLLKETLGDRDDITRVLDWNFDEAPYFIESEYTAGGSLVEWADAAGGLDRIPLATRLDVVAQVAAALAAAHSVGVLHKDVKPGNVLVTTDGEGRVKARLSDFGVGLVTERQRLVDAGITVVGMTELQTHDFSPGGTRLYQAPELLEGKPATLQADIYALGVVLYQMVVGDFTRALAPGWDRDVTDELLREDISLAVDGSPEQRLSSASLLNERLRLLENRRLERAARREEQIRAERLQATLSSVRRRRRLMAATIGGLATVTTIVTILLYDVKQQARRANREAETARQISKFLVDLFETSTPYRYRRLASKITAREILDRGAERIDRELTSEPLVKARLMQTIGVIYNELGAYDTADRLIRRALEIRRRIHDGGDMEVVESMLALAEVLREKADFEEAERLGFDALELRRALLIDERPDEADCQELLARILYNKGDLDAAETHYREGLKINRERPRQGALSESESLHGLAVVLMGKGNLDEAEIVYRDLLERQVRTLGHDHPDVAHSMTSLALLLAISEKWEEAQELYEDTIAIRKRVLGDNHPDTALAINNLAEMLLRKGDFPEAERYLKESLVSFQQSLGHDHPYVAFAEYGLARLFKEQGQRQRARSHLKQALAIYREALGDGHPDVVYVVNDLNDLLESTGD